jgi:hypothetical protein
MFDSPFPLVVCRTSHVVFTLFMFAGIYWCPTHIVLCFCFVFRHLVCPMLSVSLCFSSSCVPYVVSFSVFFVILCALCCQFLCVFRHLVYPMLPVSLDCPFLIVPSVFSIVYFLTAYFYSCSLNKL